MRENRCTMMIIRLAGLIWLLLIVGLEPAGADPLGYASDWSSWITPPGDSAQEENVRVWIANETGRASRFKVDILDASNAVIRHFVDGKMKAGYLNLYWDRKDDQGDWVLAGEYRYQVIIKQKTRTGSLKVAYAPEELLVNVFPEDPRSPGTIRYDIRADSLRVTAGVYFWNGRPKNVPITDSLFYRGSYTFTWTNPGDSKRAIYAFQLTAAGITHKVRIIGATDDAK